MLCILKIFVSSEDFELYLLIYLEKISFFWSCLWVFLGYITVSMGPHDVSISSERPRAAVWITSFDNFPSLRESLGEGNGTPLQFCCLENPRNGGAWWAPIASHRVGHDWSDLAVAAAEGSLYFIVWYWIPWQPWIFQDRGWSANSVPVTLLWKDGSCCTP